MPLPVTAFTLDQLGNIPLRNDVTLDELWEAVREALYPYEYHPNLKDYVEGMAFGPFFPDVLDASRDLGLTEALRLFNFIHTWQRSEPLPPELPAHVPLPPTGEPTTDWLDASLSWIGKTLGALQAEIGSALDGSIDDVASALLTTPESVQQRVREMLEHARNRVGGIGQAIGGGIDFGLDMIGRMLDAIQKNIITPVGEMLDAGALAVGKLGSDLYALIAGDVEESQRRLGELWADIVTDPDSVVKTLQDLMSDPSKLAGSIADRIFGKDKGLVENLAEGGLKGTFGALWNLIEALELEKPELLDVIFNKIRQSPDKPPVLEEFIARLDDGTAPVDFFFKFFGMLISMLEFFRIQVEPELYAFQAARWSHQPIRMPSLEQYATSERLGISNKDAVNAVARLQGYSPEAMDVLRINQTALLTANEVMTLFLRGHLDQQEVHHHLKQLGYRVEDAAQWYRLAEQIPPISDLLRMQVKEVFSPEIRRKFGQDDEQPTEIFPHTRAQGLSDEWVKQYWAAHWELPSSTQGYAMFQRTTDAPIDADADRLTLSDGTVVYNLIGKKTLDALQKANDIMPFWRDKLALLNYAPLTRVDVRRMRKLGVLTHAEVMRAYLDLGYSPQNARRLADFVEEDIKGSQKEKNEPFRRMLAGKYVQGFVRSRYTSSELSAALLDLQYDQDEVAATIADAEYAREDVKRDIAERGIRKLYVQRFVSEQEAVQAMRQHGFGNAESAAVVELWALERKFDELSDTARQEKELTKGEILDLYYEKEFDRGDAERELTKLGYDGNEINLMLRNLDLKDARKGLNAIIAALRKAFLANKLTEAQLSHELDKTGITAARRQNLIRAWSIEADI